MALKVPNIDLWLFTMPTWSLADVDKELRDASAFLGQKKAGSGAQSATAIEDNLIKGIICKVESLCLTTSTSLSLYKTLDESCTYFSQGMKDKLKATIETVLTKPAVETGNAHTFKPQTLELPQYLSTQEWALLMGGSSYHEKVRLLTAKCSNLGIKSLGEQTCGSIVACLLCSLTAIPDPPAVYQMALDTKLAFQPCASNLPFLRVYPQNPRDLPAEILSAAYGQGEAPSGQVPDKYPMMLGEVILRKSNKKLKSWYAAQQAKEQQKVAQPTPQPASSAPSPSTYGQFSMADMMAGFMHFSQAMQRNMHQSPKKLQPSGDRLALTNCQTTPSVDQGSAQQFEPKLRHPQKSAHVPTSLPIEDKKAEAHSEVNATQEAHGNTPKGNPPQTEQPQHTGRDVEEAAFTALKSKKGIAQAKAKSNAKAKAKGTPKAKGKAKAQAKSAASSSCRKRPASKISQPMPFTYEPGEPEERWDGKYDSWCSKHYHTCRNMAVNAGYDDDEAKELGKEARKKATLLYKKVFG